MKLPTILSSTQIFCTNVQVDSSSIIQIKAKLTLTRPKEPEFETAQRVRSVKVKSSAELEEEMMAKMPKFKARPFNKKVVLSFSGIEHACLLYGVF